MSWREGEPDKSAARKPQEQSAQLKGVFGEGASRVAVPDSARSGQDMPADGTSGQTSALTPEQFQRKAQSRGLWDGGANKAPSQPTQPRAETLPRAVVGTASPNAANTNFRNPSIGNEVSPPLPAALTEQQPMAAGQASLDAAAAANKAAKQQRELDLGLAETEDVRTGKPVRKRDLRGESDADPDKMDTMELDMAKFIQKAGLPQKAPSATDNAAQPARAAQASPAAQPAEPAPPTPPAVAAAAARAQVEAAKPGTTTEKIATRPTPSPASSAVLLALIVVAAIIAVLFIGAALGMWHLPWTSGGAGASGAGHSSLSKTVPAKSLPEMRTPVVPAAAPAQVIPTAIAAPAAPPQEHAEEPAQPAAAMAADEAAPMHAAASSGGDPEDEADRPTSDVAELLSAARAELRAGHAKEAEALLRPELEKNPNDHHAAEVLAQALIARGAAVEAVPIVQRIVKKRPSRASYRVLLGDALRRAGDEPGAKAAYREALALDPNLRDAHARLGKLNQ